MKEFKQLNPFNVVVILSPERGTGDLSFLGREVIFKTNGESNTSITIRSKDLLAYV